jgi:hypothetical protein
VIHARDPKNRGVFPTVLRPDLLLTDDGFVLTELDSVPGGIGLTAFLNRLYGAKPGALPAPRNPKLKSRPGTQNSAFSERTTRWSEISTTRSPRCAPRPPIR